MDTLNSGSGGLRATYWAPSSIIATWERSQFGSPVHLEVVSLEGDGGIALDTKGLLLETTGYIFLGASEELDPRMVDGAREVTALGFKPDLRKLRQLSVAYVH
jgi:hypothetical protein